MSRSQIRMARKRSARLDKITLALIAAFIVLALASAVIAFILVRSLVSSWSMTSLPGAPEISSSGKPIKLPEGTAYVQPLQPEGGLEPEPWDGASRVTILVMGLDYRDWESGETPRTDTMILLTLDPLSDTAGLLSIPRDLWVNIPGYDYAKINTAYYLGEIYNLPGGGPALAVQTIQQLLGVPINYYAQVDFYAFARFIDELGGLDLNVRDEITVDPLGPANTVKLYPGVQTLDGATALAYARARYTDGGDFDRSQRQQDVILAIREQILALDMMPTLIAKAPALYNDIASGIRTNLNLQQTLQLALLAAKVPENSIRQGVIGPPEQVILGTSPDGLSIAIPVHDKIRILRDQIFTTGGPISPATVNQDPLALAQQEQARIVVQNGTQDPGLASRTSEYLRSLGLNVLGETNADQLYGSTSLIVVSGKPYTVKYLADTMGISTSDIYNRFEADAGADVIVIIGSNWANSNPIP
ncbi:MAG: LCP family protein [Anaerolineaceae bacterium]|nr:LCP family protein [Anaerolineaceae bacterium]